jgi:hypothetical protein
MFPNHCSELLPGTEADITMLTAGYFEAYAINTTSPRWPHWDWAHH